MNKEISRELNLLFVGDVMLGRLVNDELKFQASDYPWGDTLPVFQSADLRFCNLECVISDWSMIPEETLGKAFHFRSDSKNVAVLNAARINAVSLANNHVLDFGERALFETLEALDRSFIVSAGAGRNIYEASKVKTLQFEKSKIGFVAFTDNEPGWEAREKRAGVFYVPVDLSDIRAKRLLKIVAESKKIFDFMVVSAHWGPNWGYNPPPEQITFAHALIDAGADIIFGHSAHVMRGVEVYKHRPIIYSAGNFIDDYAIDEVERNDQSAIFIAEVRNKEISRIRIYPTVIKDFQALLAERRQAEEIASKMAELCSRFKTPVRARGEEGYLEITVK